jgi:hypothetical protein
MTSPVQSTDKKEELNTKLLEALIFGLLVVAEAEEPRRALMASNVLDKPAERVAGSVAL